MAAADWITRANAARQNTITDAADERNWQMGTGMVPFNEVDPGGVSARMREAAMSSFTDPTGALTFALQHGGGHTAASLTGLKNAVSMPKVEMPQVDMGDSMAPPHTQILDASKIALRRRANVKPGQNMGVPNVE